MIRIYNNLQAFAKKYKKAFTQEGYIFYYENDNKDILASANVDVVEDDDGNIEYIEVYNLLSTAEDKKLVPAFINHMSDFISVKFPNKVLNLGPANGNLEKLYKSWQSSNQIYGTEKIIIGTNEHEEAPDDFRLDKGNDRNNPVLLPIGVKDAKDKKDKPPNGKTGREKYGLYVKWKDSNGTISYYKYEKNNSNKIVAIKLSDEEVQNKIWEKSGYYDPKEL